MSGRLAGATPMPPPGRWESQAGSARWRAVFGGSRPAFRLRSRSRRSQTPEIPCPCHHGCAQKRGSQVAIGPTCAAQFPALAPFMQTFPSLSPPCDGAHQGPNLRQTPYETGKETRIPPSPTAETRKGAGVCGCSVRFTFGFGKPAQPTPELVKVQAFATLG